MITLTRAQRAALYRKWTQSNQGLSYWAFRRSVQACLHDESVMVYWCGMWLGIEPDGYTHS